METKVNHTKLAYLLALQDLSATLSDQERQILKEIAQELQMQPKAWTDHIEPRLLEIIQGNPQLQQSYQTYEKKLDRLGEIPSDLLPTVGELNQLVTNQSSLVNKGFSETELASGSGYELQFHNKGFSGTESASGYEQQLNNVVIVVTQADKPEEAVKQLGFLGKLKQLLD